MRLIIILLSIIIFISEPANAYTPAEQAEISSVETYLNNISTLKADFTQTAADGAGMNGVFLLKRPGRLRFEYAPPVEDFIVADGTFIHYYDGEMKQHSQTSIEQTLANFFLIKDIKLGGKIDVANIKSDKNTIELTVVQKDDTMAGSLTLLLDKNPLQLKKWHIVDAQGITTSIELKNIEFGSKLSDKLFYYYDPEKKKTILNK